MSTGDYEHAKAELRENYHEQTGHELPEHVVENIDVLSPSPGVVESIETAERLTQKSEETSREQALAVTFILAFGAGALIIGTIAATFGTALAAVVAFGAGFVLAGVMML